MLNWWTDGPMNWRTDELMDVIGLAVKNWTETLCLFVCGNVLATTCISLPVTHYKLMWTAHKQWKFFRVISCLDAHSCTSNFSLGKMYKCWERETPSLPAEIIKKTDQPRNKPCIKCCQMKAWRSVSGLALTSVFKCDSHHHQSRRWQHTTTSKKQ